MEGSPGVGPQQFCASFRSAIFLQFFQQYQPLNPNNFMPCMTQIFPSLFGIHTSVSCISRILTCKLHYVVQKASTSGRARPPPPNQEPISPWNTPTPSKNPGSAPEEHAETSLQIECCVKYYRTREQEAVGEHVIYWSAQECQLLVDVIRELGCQQGKACSVYCFYWCI